MIRVLQIVGNMRRGGLETMIMNYYRNMNREKVQFDFIVHGIDTGIYEIEILQLGGKIFHVTPKNEHFLRNLREIRNIIRENRYDIVHVHQDAMSMFALREAKKAGASYRIAHAHSTSMPPSLLGRILYPYALSRTTRYCTHKVACSEVSANYLFHGDIENTIYLNNGIDTNLFAFCQTKRNEIRAALGWEENFVLGHVGNFLYPKNHTFVLKTFNEIHLRYPKSILILCGSGEDMDKYKSLAKQMGLSEYIHFFGNVKNVSELMQGFDTLILPSLYEGFPVVTVEAQCSGLPTYVSDVITKETLLTNTIRYLSLSKGPASWADEILYTFTHVQREDHSTEVKNKGFDIRDVSQKLQELYLSL